MGVPKFTVKIERVERYSREVDVVAKDAAAAGRKALRATRRQDQFRYDDQDRDTILCVEPAST